MILVDTNVLVDIWSQDPAWARWSEAAIARAAAEEELVVDPVICAELSLGFESEPQLREALRSAGIRVVPLPVEAAWPAARAFAAYRRRGGARRAPLPDFFIGAHAQAADFKLLTRDPRRYRTYFPGVKLIAPKGP